MNNIEFNSRIDTLETKEPLSNRAASEIIDIKGTEAFYNKNLDIITKYNPNNYGPQYNNEYKLSKTMSTFKEMQDQLTVIDDTKVAITRVDIATDIDKDFYEISKFLDFIHKCIRAKEKDGLGWTNLDEEDMEANNYLYKSKNKLMIEFYNKHKQNSGATYPTRMEIRFLRIFSKNLEFHVKKTMDLWKAMPNNLEIVEQEMIRRLKQKWIQENKINTELKFNEFVYAYRKYFYTRGILKSLYDESGLTREFRSWLTDYRKRKPMELYSKADLTNFSKSVIKSLKAYKNS